MEPEKVRYVRGSIELVADAVEAALDAASRAHTEIARQVYAPFALLGPLAAPAHLVEQIQTAITDHVYLTIRATNRLVSDGALSLLEQQVAEAQPSLANPEPPR